MKIISAVCVKGMVKLFIVLILPQVIKVNCFDAFNNGTQHFTTPISHTIYFTHHTQTTYSKCNVQV